jgi:hypothetical protein
MHVTHLECSLTGERYSADELQGLSSAGKPLLVRYDLAAAARTATRESLSGRAPDMWKWSELLPLPEGTPPVSLGEPQTPIVPLAKTAAREGARDLLVKDEGRLPTGSFKARGLAMAVTMAKELGVSESRCRPTAMPAPRSPPTAPGPAFRDGRLPGRHARDQRARDRAAGRAKSGSPTGRSTNAAARREGKAAKGAGSTARRSRSPTGSRARRRWASSWPSSSAGRCPMSSSTRPAAAPASSACGRRSTRWRRSG